LQVATVTGKQVVAAARKYLGAPFRLHGRDKKGIDCIQLILAVGRDFGLVVDDIPDYDLKGLKFKTAEKLFLDNGCSPIDPKRVQPGDIFTACNLMNGAASGTGIVSETNGPSMFCGVSGVIHCETETPGYSKPRMRVVEDRLGSLDVLQCQLAGVDAATIARAMKFYAYPFVQS
jgi:hypothetical protein